MSTHSFIVNPKNEAILININGEFFKRNEAKISVFDSGFLLGDGIWEGIRFHQSVYYQCLISIFLLIFYTLMQTDYL